MLLPASSLSPGTDLDTLRAHWDEADGSGLWFGPDAPVQFGLPPAQVAELRSAWIRGIKDHPVDYLQHRIAYSLSLLGITQSTYGVFAPSADPGYWGFDFTVHPEFSPSFRSWYGRSIATSGVFASFRLWMFVAVLFGVGATNRGRRSVAVRTLVAAGLGSTVSFMMAGASSGFRYAWFTMLCALLVLAIGLSWVAEWVARRRQPGPGDVSPPASDPTATDLEVTPSEGAPADDIVGAPSPSFAWVPA